MLSVIILNVTYERFMLNAIMLTVIIVVAPAKVLALLKGDVAPSSQTVGSLLRTPISGQASLKMD
jgi:hypothetical protein